MVITRHCLFLDTLAESNYGVGISDESLHPLCGEVRNKLSH